MKAIVTYFRRYPSALIMIAVTMIWMTITLVRIIPISRKLAQEGKYTIGIIKEIKGAKSGRWVRVEFEFNHQTYTSQDRNERIPLSWVGEKVFIKFLPSDPVAFVFYDTVPISDSLLGLPPQIWDSLPIK